MLGHPEYAQHQQEIQQKQDSLYEATFVAYTRNEFQTVMSNYKQINASYPFAELMPKFSLLNALSLGKSGDQPGMRLGAYPCNIKHDSLAYKVYGKETIKERHRHRYEFNNDYREQYEQAGVKCSGINPESDLVEIIELPSKKWFIGTQFHPEYSSTVVNPHPLFIHFIKAAITK